MLRGMPETATTTKEEFFEKWDEIVYLAESSFNPVELLHTAAELLGDQRQAGGNFAGDDCPHLKFLLAQIAFLVLEKELTWDEREAEIKQVNERQNERIQESMLNPVDDRTYIDIHI